MSNISRYLHSALEELHHVRWPTRQQAIRLSAIVIGFVAVSSVAFGGVDYLLTQVVNLILSLVV